MKVFTKIIVALFIIINSYGYSQNNVFGRNELVSQISFFADHNQQFTHNLGGLLTVEFNSIKSISSNTTIEFLIQLFVALLILMLSGTVIHLLRKNNLKNEIYQKRVESLRTAHQRLLERNKSLENKIKSRTEEVIEHISQHDEILSKLSQSEVRFEKIFANNSDAMAIIDYETLAIVEINQAAIQIFSLTLPEKRPFHFSQFTSDGSSYILYKIASIVKFHQQITDYVVSENKSANNQKWFSITSQIIKYNEYQYYLISAKNITKSKKAELLLIENEKRLKMLTENINDMIWLLNENLQITYISPSVLINLGFHPEDVFNKSISSFLTIQSHQKFKEIITDYIASSAEGNNISLELEFVDNKGHIHIGEFKAQIHKNGTKSWFIYGVSRDITEKKKTEVALRQSEQLYRLITNNVNDVIFTSNTSLKIKYVNQAIFSFLGYTPEELLELPIEEFFSKKSIETVNNELTNYFNKIYQVEGLENKLVFDSEIDFISKDGTLKWGIVQINLLLDEKNYIFGLIGTIHDNTQKHQIELIESNTNNFFKKLFYESPIMMVIVNNNGLLENVNNAFIEKTGYTQERIYNSKISDIVKGDNGEFSAVIMRKESAFAILRTIKNINIDILYDVERMDTQTDTEPDSGKYLIVMRDITHQLKAETIAKNREEQFKALSEHSPDIIARYNSKMECTYVNSTIEKEFGIAPDKVIDKNIASIGLSERESEFLNKNFVQVFVDGKERVVDFSLPIGNEAKHFQCRIIPEFSGSNHVQTIMAVTRNMTEYINAIMMLHTNVKQMTFLNKAIIYCNQSKTKTELYQNILLLIIQEFGFDGGEIYEYYPEKDYAVAIFEQGLSATSPNKIFPIDHTHPMYEELIVNHHQILYSQDTASPLNWVENKDINTIFILPVLSNNITIGAISLNSEKIMDIPDSLKEIIQTVSQELGSALDRIEAISMHLESEENYRSLVETTTDLVWKVNEFLVFTFVNDKCVDLLGFTPQELIGTSIISTIALEEHIKIKKFLELNKTLLEKFTLVDVPLIKKTGQAVHVEINGYPLIDRSGNFIGYAGINRDISMRKINEDLRQRKEIAERMAQMKQQFLSNISHELRTPLTAIIGHTEIISNKVNDNEIRSHIGSIESNSKSLLHLISEILDLSKIEAGKFQLQKEPINIVKFFEEINLTFTPLAKAKNIQFDIEINPFSEVTLLLDELRLQQVVNNLVGNAIKFTERGTVKVIANLIKNSAYPSTMDVIISVIDTGIGIEETQLSTIFDSFTQADGQSNKKYGGSGLGLSISKNLIELMDGSITIESKKGQGSTFKIIIPSIEISELEAKNVLFHPILTNKRIGIIENKPNLREILTNIVRHNDCSISSISLAQLITDNLSESHFDIIIINLDDILLIENSAVIFEALAPHDIHTIYISGKPETKATCSHLLKAPVDSVILHNLIVNILIQQNSKNNSYPQQIQHELLKWSTEDRFKLLDELQKQCSPLWSKASSSNSIDQITQFRNSLSAISKQFNLKFVKHYADEIKIGLKTFDIEKIKQLLEVYPYLVSYLKKQ